MASAPTIPTARPAREEPQALREDEAEHRAPVRAQGHAHADLVPAAGDAPPDHSVDPHASEQRAGPRRQRQHLAPHPGHPVGARPGLLQGADVVERAAGHPGSAPLPSPAPRGSPAASRARPGSRWTKGGAGRGRRPATRACCRRPGCCWAPWTSRATPTTRSQGPSARRSRRSSGLVSGQKRRARPSLTTATSSPFATSSSRKSRPSRIAIPRAAKVLVGRSLNHGLRALGGGGREALDHEGPRGPAASEAVAHRQGVGGGGGFDAGQPPHAAEDLVEEGVASGGLGVALSRERDSSRPARPAPRNRGRRSAAAGSCASSGRPHSASTTDTASSVATSTLPEPPCPHARGAASGPLLQRGSNVEACRLEGGHQARHYARENAARDARQQHPGVDLRHRPERRPHRDGSPHQIGSPESEERRRRPHRRPPGGGSR